MNLDLVLKSPSDNIKARGTNLHNTITLIVPNIYKDCNSDFDELIKGLIHIYVVELICGYVVHDLWIDIQVPLCYNRKYCPIAEIMRKCGYNYKMGLSPKDFIF